MPGFVIERLHVLIEFGSTKLGILSEFYLHTFQTCYAEPPATQFIFCHT
jgi:hypothetical protein